VVMDKNNGKTILDVIGLGGSYPTNNHPAHRIPCIQTNHAYTTRPAGGASSPSSPLSFSSSSSAGTKLPPRPMTSKMVLPLFLCQVVDLCGIHADRFFQACIDRASSLSRSRSGWSWTRTMEHIVKALFRHRPLRSTEQ
jgi:hypothetical protein